MTPEDKQLLLKDLSARLPYGVVIDYKEDKDDCRRWILSTLYTPGVSRNDTTPDFDGRIESAVSVGKGMRITTRKLYLEKMLPYLRPMSSMTEKEKLELDNMEFEMEHLKASFYAHECLIHDFFYKHHLDIRGLIPMGLALEAPEGMYKI